MKNSPVPVEKKFNAFNGVFIPTFLAIIGVILYLRLGYVVGSAGVLATLIIILLAASLTLATGFSLSALTTNIKIGAGGVYSIITKTLGLEAGGSVGIPLFFAQLFSITLYLFGFSEAWQYIFPSHNTTLIVLSAFVCIFFLTFISTNIAVRFQLIIFILVIISLISVFGDFSWFSVSDIETLTLQFPDNFWVLFALFFPAVTGIISGIGLSGKLENAKEQIPKGLISAIIISSLIYILVAFELAFSATKEQLLNNSTILIDISLFGPAVILGIIATTFSSALTSFISAPLLLQAMSKKSVIPGSKHFTKTNPAGVPQNAIIFSAIPIVLTLIFANLDSIAPVITMFFLVTYAIINLIIFFEQSAGLVTFRPTLRIPWIIPLFGAVISIVFMFYINIWAGLASVIFIIFSYTLLIKRRLRTKDGDIRSSLLISFSEWAVKKILVLPDSSKYNWKPNILLPVLKTKSFYENYPLINAITNPNGNITVLGIRLHHKEAAKNKRSKKNAKQKMTTDLSDLHETIKKLNEKGVLISETTVSNRNFVETLTISFQAIQGQKLPPNIIFIPQYEDKLPMASVKKIFNVARQKKTGIILSDRNDIGFDDEHDIHIWIPTKALKGGVIRDRKFNLALLTAYRMFTNTGGKIHIRMCVPKKDKEKAQSYIKRLLYESRFPESTEVVISTDKFSKDFIDTTKFATHICPVINFKDIDEIRKIKTASEKTILFILDSGKEDVLA